jgi:multiple antibiotic resistance protein
MQEWSTYARMVTALFVIENPVGAIPLFISLTAGQTVKERKRTAHLAATTVALVLMAAAWQGVGSWQGFGAPAPFLFGGALALLAALLLATWLPRASRQALRVYATTEPRHSPPTPPAAPCQG